MVYTPPSSFFSFYLMISKTPSSYKDIPSKPSLLQRSPRDILPVLHPLEMNALYPLIRLRDRLLQRGCHGGGSDDAASGRGEYVIV